MMFVSDFSSWHSIVEGQAVNIGLDEPVKCQVDATNYRHFVLVKFNTTVAVCLAYHNYRDVPLGEIFRFLVS